jgi:hypothetical protein
MKNELPMVETDNSLEITLCGKGSCKCPAVDIRTDRDDVIIGGKEEGFTTFTKEQFQLLVNEVKNGRFDKFVV